MSGTFNISSFDGIDITSTKPMTMGIWQSNPSTAFKGALDRVILFNETLTLNHVIELMAGEEEGNNLPLIINPADSNPASTHLNIQFNLAESQKVNIRLYNLKGMLVSNIFEGQLAAGNNHINWNKNAENIIPAGMYILQLISDQNRFTQLVVFN